MWRLANPHALFGPVVQGQCGRVSLPSYQQTLLNGMDRALEARDPRLASMFSIFTRLTREEGPPRTEQLTRGTSQTRFTLPRAIRWARVSAVLPIVLVACLMLAIVVLGITTATGRTCPPSTSLHHVVPGKNAVCRASANGLRK